MSAHKKLIDARMKLQSTKLTKSGKNMFANYDYFELGDFLPTVQSIFAGLGLIGIVSYTSDVATLTITDTESNTSLSITSPMGSATLKGCHEVQNIGAVQTYQRRYLWVTAMEIVEHDAIDAVTGGDERVGGKSSAILTEADIADVYLAMRESDDTKSLQGIFGAAYRKANKTQAQGLKVEYDKRKSLLEVPS